MAKRPIDVVITDASDEDGPAKRQKVDSDEKNPHAGKTLVFFDLGHCKGVEFVPKIFYQMPTKTYEILLHGLETGEDEEDIHMCGEYGMEYPVTLSDIKFTASYDVDPDAYMQAYKYFTEVLQQKLQTHGLRITIS